MLSSARCFAPRFMFPGLVFVALACGCDPMERDYGSGGATSASSSTGMGGAGGASTSSSGSGGGMSGSTSGTGGAPMCPPNTADCNGDGFCESNLLGDVDHCGACDTPCKATGNTMTSCIAGKCEYTCNAGFGDCDNDPATACTPLVSDPANCGACGHDCFGGACMAGACQPVEIPTLGFGSGFISIAVYGAELYLGTNVGEILHAPIDGGASLLLTNVNGTVRSLAVNANGIYATTGNRVQVLNQNGNQVFGTISYPETNFFAVDTSTLVWSATGGGRTRRADALGGNQKDIGYNESQPRGIVLQGLIARWLNGNGEIREGTAQANGGMTNGTTIFSGLPPFQSSYDGYLLQDGNILYGTTGGTVFSAELGSPAPVELYPTGGTEVGGLVAADKYLYWTTASNGQVWRGLKDNSSPPVIVAKMQNSPRGLAVGPKAIYWVNELDSKIMRLAR